MTQNEFAEELSKRLKKEGIFNSQSRNRAKQIIEILSEVILDCLFDGDEVSLKNIGKLRAIEQEEKEFYSNILNKRTKSPAKVKIYFSQFEYANKKWNMEKDSRFDIEKNGERVIQEFMENFK